MPRVADARPREPEARLPAYIIRSEEWATLVRRSPLAAHVWLILSSYANREDVAWCSQRRLAALTGSWRRSIVEVIRLLVDTGWVSVTPRFDKETGARIADQYQLRLPGGLEAARQVINDRLKGNPVGAIPGFREDDIFVARSRVYTRMARLPQSVLGSEEFGRLRERGATVLHAYLLLLVYAPSGERVPGHRLAEEAAMSLPRWREAVAVLADPEDRWIEVVKTKAKNGGDRPNSYTVIGRLVKPAAVLDADEPGEAPEGQEVYGQGRPPLDLVNQLPVEQFQDAMILDTEKERWTALWALLKDEGLWPRRKKEDPIDASTRLVRQFHGMMRGVDASHYQPSPHEHAFVMSLFSAYGDGAWRVANYIVAQMHRTKFRAGNAQAMRPYVEEAAAACGLTRKRS